MHDEAARIVREREARERAALESALRTQQAAGARQRNAIISEIISEIPRALARLAQLGYPGGSTRLKWIRGRKYREVVQWLVATGSPHYFNRDDMGSDTFYLCSDGVLGWKPASNPVDTKYAYLPLEYERHQDSELELLLAGLQVLGR